MKSKFYGLMKNNVCRMAYMLVKRNHLKNPFSKSRIAGKKWVKLFLKRYKQKLLLKRPTGTFFAEAFGFSKKKVDAFFDLFEEVYTKDNYTIL